MSAIASKPQQPSPPSDRPRRAWIEESMPWGLLAFTLGRVDIPLSRKSEEKEDT